MALEIFSLNFCSLFFNIIFVFNFFAALYYSNLIKSERQITSDVEEFEEEENVVARNATRFARQSFGSFERATLIEPSLQSQLIVTPGSTVRVIFDVTNMAEQVTFHNFQVTGERSWLINFSPRRYKKILKKN